MKKLASLFVALFSLVWLTGAGWLPLARTVVGVAYQGPGDVVSGAALWGSCARAYNAAYANGTNLLCDLVDSAAPTTVICTLRVLTTGFVDLAGTYCTGSVTPLAKCAAATGAVCNISKVYDQTGNARDWTQATAANQPTLTFSALGGLPGMTFNAGSGQVNAAALTLTGPYSISGVFKRVGALEGGLLAVQTTLIGTIMQPSANTIGVYDGSAPVTQTATDGSYHAAAGILDNITPVATAIVDGSPGSNGNAGSAAISSGVLRIGRSSGGVTLIGTVMEAGLWNVLAFNATQYGNLNTNQHSLVNGYNF